MAPTFNYDKERLRYSENEKNSAKEMRLPTPIKYREYQRWMEIGTFRCCMLAEQKGRQILHDNALSIKPDSEQQCNRAAECRLAQSGSETGSGVRRFPAPSSLSPPKRTDAADKSCTGFAPEEPFAAR